VPVSYLSHITGHGLLKLMRPSRDLTYRITALPPVPEVLGFLAERSEMDAHAAYSTLNMGSGFAVYTAAGTGNQVVEIARGLGHEALIAGAVEDGPRQVVVEPIDVVYADAELDLSPDAA
jgi:phosphoribosylformylglycinamidine cyclo-ligase